LTGLTSNIQNQINNIVSTTPIGTVISFAGSSSSLPGYLPCNGNSYPIPAYTALFNIIGYTYGGNEATGFFNVPNFQGIFLRGSGSQSVNLNAVAGSNTAVQKMYSSPNLGTVYADEAAQIQTSNYVTSINQEVKSFITSANTFGPPNYNFNYSNAVASLNYTSGNDIINNGRTENFPVHTSIQYFIKY
jgi:microcystin-dependent protein